MLNYPPDCQSALQAPVMQQIYQVESSFNPFAIGVVGGRLVRQPKNLGEAVATAVYLARLGRNFSVGQGQVNRVHFSTLGWNADIRSGFDVCKNVIAAHDIFKKCYARAIASGFTAKQDYSATDAALSCYYSGSLSAGKTNPDITRYINAVLAAGPKGAETANNAAPAIPLATPGQGKDINKGQNAAHLKAVSKKGAGMLLSGKSAVNNTHSSMMLIHKEKD